jgi:hypothetical protein
MLSTREADLDAKIFRLILEDVRSEMREDDRADLNVESDDITACSRAGSFLPVYGRGSDLISTFIALLEPCAEEGWDGWCYVAKFVGRDDVDYDDAVKIPPGAAEEITASIIRVLASARLSLERHTAASRRRLPSSLSIERLRTRFDRTPRRKSGRNG